jgi:predicted  nucleic acid-binding Zn-ribbon protein
MASELQDGAVLATKLANIEGIMLRLESKIDSVDTRLQAVERNDASSQATVQLKLENISQQIKNMQNDYTQLENRVPDDLSKTLSELVKFKDYAEPILKTCKWAGAMVGGLIIALLWGIFTHSIIITVP